MFGGHLRGARECGLRRRGIVQPFHSCRDVECLAEVSGRAEALGLFYRAGGQRGGALNVAAAECRVGGQDQ